VDTRDRILGRVRKGLSRVPGRAGGGTAGQYIADHPCGPRPRFDVPLVDLFTRRADALTTSVERLEHPDKVPAAVAQYLAGIGVSPAVTVWAGLASLDWAGAGVEAAVRRARDGDAVGVTGAYCAIAETGTLMMLSGPETHASVSLLPETHVAILSASRIVPCMEDAWTLLRSEHGVPPRAVNFISGPSRTADIEQTVTLGAHGPYRVHVLIVP
jgi:L-lactate dehydrogenase complex protein LldG